MSVHRSPTPESPAQRQPQGLPPGSVPGVVSCLAGEALWTGPSKTSRRPIFIHSRRREGISNHSVSTSLLSPCPHSSSAPSLSALRCQLRVYHPKDPSPGVQEPGGHMENGRYPLGSPCQGYFSLPSEEGGEVGVLSGVVSPWSGAHGTSHWAAQPWSMLHWLALGTQPRDNGAIHTARALHNNPLGQSPWLDGERVSVYGVWG